MINFLKKKKLICVINAVIILSTALFGCSNNAPEEEVIVLKEPVNVASNYVVAENRDLYDTTIFSSVVSPYVEEYSFAKDQVFKSYEFVPGENVNRGDTIVTARTRDSEKAIKDIDEQIEDFLLNHTVEEEHFKTDLNDAYKNEAKSNGNESVIRNRQRMEETHKEDSQLFALELQHLKDKKALLEKESSNANIKSDISGAVVNCAFVYGAEEVQKDIPLVAVGDLSRKLLKCDYISKATLAKADDFFAVINGKRYELENESIDQEEATILKNNGETVYSTFAIDDKNDEVELGQFAVIVLIRESHKGVLCVPKDSVKNDNGINYVYVTDGTNNVYTQVETGMQDEFFIEILSGLKVGDKVLSNASVKKGKNFATLEMGTCVTEETINGNLYYPFSQWIMSPMDSGTAYIKEILVTEFEEVKAGAVLFTIEVIQDDIEIERLNNKIARLNARIADEVARQAEIDKTNLLIDDKEKKLEDSSIGKNIISYQRDLILTENQLKKLKKYTGIIEVKAPSDGVVADVGTLKPGDIIYADTKVMQFADISKSFIVLKDEKGVLNYGQPVEIDYANDAGSRDVISGTVVTVNNTSLSDKMVKQWALVAVDEKDKAKIQGSGQNSSGMWFRNMYKVNVNTREMKNVILVPKAAVEMKGGSTYVRVINPDGSISMKGFIAGGSNGNYYWSITGLSEGTNICWE